MDTRTVEAQGCAARLAPRAPAAVDHRVSLIRDALLKTHGLYLADSEIRTLLIAIDRVGVPLPYAQTVVIGEPDPSMLPTGFDFPETLRLPPFDGIEDAQLALER